MYLSTCSPPVGCNVMPCQNGGTCLEGGASCQCTAEYTGRYCTTPVSEYNAYVCTHVDMLFYRFDCTYVRTLYVQPQSFYGFFPLPYNMYHLCMYTVLDCTVDIWYIHKCPKIMATTTTTLLHLCYYLSMCVYCTRLNAIILLLCILSCATHNVCTYICTMKYAMILYIPM